MEVKNTLTSKGQRDYKLIQQALQKGDQSAYAELLNLYRDSIYYTMLKMTHDPHDAEDLTIEAFGKAFKNLQQYTTDYAFSTWLFKIASNNCIDFIRKKKMHNNILESGDNKSGSLSTKIADNELNPEEEIINNQKILMMREVIHRLKPHYKKLIELRYFKEYSYEELVQELNLPLGTVKVQLFRARTFLYNILKNSEEKI